MGPEDQILASVSFMKVRQHTLFLQFVDLMFLNNDKCL